MQSVEKKDESVAGTNPARGNSVSTRYSVESWPCWQATLLAHPTESMVMRKKRSGKVRVGVLVLTLLVFAFFSLIGIALFGRVAGEEFSPQQFTMRRFGYWQIPLLRVQIWPVSLRKITGDEDELARHIRMQRLNGDVSKNPVHWDIMLLDEVGSAPFYGNASILTQYLRQPGAKGTESWLDWSKKHPKQAKILWPLVAKLAEKNLYALIPEVLDEARSSQDLEHFGDQLHRQTSEAIMMFADAEELEGEHERAAELRRLAASLPESS